jgi:hypothetical protein
LFFWREKTVMKRLLIVAMTLVVASTASADREDLWNFAKVLDKGRSNFATLCKNAGGSIKRLDATRLHCVIPNEDAADVVVQFKGGKAWVYAMAWGGTSAGLVALSNMRSAAGEEDGVTEEGGCRMFWWMVPSGGNLNYMVSMCGSSSRFVVAVVD